MIIQYQRYFEILESKKVIFIVMCEMINDAASAYYPLKTYIFKKTKYSQKIEEKLEILKPFFIKKGK